MVFNVTFNNISIILYLYIFERGCRGRYRMAVGFISTYAISACHHCCCELESRSGRGVQHYVIKLVTDLRQGDGLCYLQI
jgi:hypothetical protein